MMGKVSSTGIHQLSLRRLPGHSWDLESIAIPPQTLHFQLREIDQLRYHDGKMEKWESGERNEVSRWGRVIANGGRKRKKKK